MTEDEIVRLKEKLGEKRKEILDQVIQMESRWEDMKERDIELEEEAQKASITESYALLDDRGKEEIGLIDLALNKLVLGEYGVCESCGDDIALKRLEALPWARLCVDCAREYEKKRKTLPPTAELMGVGRLPEKFKNLSGKQILKLIYEQLNKVGSIDLERFTVAIQSGVIHLEGTVLDEGEHEVILETLTDEMGFSAIVDHLEIGDMRKERGNKATRAAARHVPVFEDRSASDEEEASEDMDETQDEEANYRPSEESAPLATMR
jgi:DnaK suppressor protein